MNTLKYGIFTIDGTWNVGGFYDPEDRWNEFYSPWFLYSAVERIADYVTDSSFERVQNVRGGELDAYVTMFEEESGDIREYDVMHVLTEEMGEIPCFQIGGSYWAWQLVTLEASESDTKDPNSPENRECPKCQYIVPLGANSCPECETTPLVNTIHEIITNNDPDELLTIPGLVEDLQNRVIELDEEIDLMAKGPSVLQLEKKIRELQAELDHAYSQDCDNCQEREEMMDTASDLTPLEVADRLEWFKDEIDQMVDALDHMMHIAGEYDHWTAYGRYGFNDILGRGNRYNHSLEKVINRIREENLR